jgi:TonB family protein
MTPVLALPERAPAQSVADSPSWRALGAALALHASLALGFASFVRMPLAADADGAQAIEVDMVMAAPEAEMNDAPLGPEAAASAAAPDSAPKEIKVERSDRPEDAPVEREAAEAVPRAEDRTKEEEDQPLTPAPASVASLASEETAPAAIEHSQAAPVARAPAIGLGNVARKSIALWQRRLAVHLDRHKRYPSGAKNLATEVSVRFTIDRAGHVVSAHLVNTSGIPTFDEAAIAMVRRADPMPPPPAALGDGPLTFTVPVVFRTR